jgi:hypothetical protein
MNFPLCPKCKTPFNKRLHRNFLIKILLPWLSLRKYYCKNCDSSYTVRVNK